MTYDQWVDEKAVSCCLCDRNSGCRFILITTSTSSQFPSTHVCEGCLEPWYIKHQGEKKMPSPFHWVIREKEERES